MALYRIEYLDALGKAQFASDQNGDNWRGYEDYDEAWDGLVYKAMRHKDKWPPRLFRLVDDRRQPATVWFSFLAHERLPKE